VEALDRNLWGTELALEQPMALSDDEVITESFILTLGQVTL
jgi:hypothetical protein